MTNTETIDAESTDRITGNRPNIMLVNCHDLGRHLGCYGRDVETPNIDGLATDGIRFDEYYCTAPQCSPSRASIVTGKQPHNHGLMGLAHRGWELDEGERPLPMQLDDLGYRTALFGFQHETSWEHPKRLGYDETDTETTRSREVVSRFADQVEGLAADGPFFASLGFTEPHREFQVDYLPDEAYDRYNPATVEPLSYLPDRPGIRTDIADLQALITATVDEAVGTLREVLRGAGIEEETLLVFTTDHGLAMPRAKGTCYDPGIETALLMYQPGVVEGGSSDALLSNVDFLPTILDLLGETPPADIDGRSFRPLLTSDNGDNGDDTDYEPRDRVFAEMNWHVRYNPMRAVRTERYKYIRNFWISPSVFLAGDIMRGEAGRELLAEYYLETRPVEELYDLREDPDEQHNLASDRTPFETSAAASPPAPDHKDALETLREATHDRMVASDDPLLDGPVSHPCLTEDWSPS
jgi:N-sulfoglucosamine sulfohydrolase